MVRCARRLLGFYQSRLVPFRILGGLYFLMLFVGGPFATHYAGLGYALISIFPIHVACCVLLLAFLIVGRGTWRMKWRDIANLVFECTVCPGYFVNICR